MYRKIAQLTRTGLLANVGDLRERKFPDQPSLKQKSVSASGATYLEVVNDEREALGALAETDVRQVLDEAGRAEELHLGVGAADDLVAGLLDAAKGALDEEVAFWDR